MRYALAIHGGAGLISGTLPEGEEAGYLSAIERTLREHLGPADSEGRFEKAIWA